MAHVIAREGLVLEDRLYSPLEIAFVRGKIAVFMMLVRAGCDLNSFHCDDDSTLKEYKCHRQTLGAGECEGERGERRREERKARE